LKFSKGNDEENGFKKGFKRKKGEESEGKEGGKMKEEKKRSFCIVN